MMSSRNDTHVCHQEWKLVSSGLSLTYDKFLRLESGIWPIRGFFLWSDLLKVWSNLKAYGGINERVWRAEQKAHTYLLSSLPFISLNTSISDRAPLVQKCRHNP